MHTGCHHIRDTRIQVPPHQRSDSSPFGAGRSPFGAGRFSFGAGRPWLENVASLLLHRCTWVRRYLILPLAALPATLATLPAILAALPATLAALPATLAALPATLAALPAILITTSFLIAAAGPATVYGQVLPFHLGGETYFNRQLDAMRWQYHGNIDFEHHRFRLYLENEFRSRLYLSDGSAQNIQDENQLRMELRQSLRENWALTGEVQSYSFTTTNLRQETGHAGIMYHPQKEIELSLMGGFMSDRRSDRLDQGWSGVFRARSRPIRAGDFIIHPAAEAHYADISPRQYATLRLHTDSEYRYEDFLMRGAFSLSGGKRESYQPSSFFNRGLTNIIESIRNDTTALDLMIRVPVSEDIGLQIDLITLSNIRLVESRPIDEEIVETIFDTRTQRRELLLRTLADYTFRRGRVAIGMNLAYINRGSRLINTANLPEEQVIRRNEILRNSNFDQSRLELFTQNRFRLSDRNELLVQAQTGILRYDTPEINQDDRDELSYQVLVTNRHAFSPYFDVSLRAGGEATHYVYLSGARSIENNWRRTIRLAPAVRWLPHDRLELRSTFLVRANYTIEDFQLEGRPKNDQSSREYAIRLDGAYTITDGWQLAVNGARSELRIGRLFWDTFQETPTDTLITYDMEAMVYRESGPHRIGLGARMFLRRDFLPQASITAEVTDENGTRPVTRSAPGLQLSRQYGPSVDINLRFYSGNRLIISGWMQRQEVRRRLYLTYPEDIASAFRREERRSSTRIYPNLEVRAVFSF